MKIECPFPQWPTAWIEIPDQFTGRHANIVDESVELAAAAGMKSTQTTFAAAARLLTDWGNIPGMNGNPDAWKFEDMHISIIHWISNAVMSRYNACFVVPKKN